MGKDIVTRIAIIAIVTRSSIRVNPFVFIFRGCTESLALLLQNIKAATKLGMLKGNTSYILDNPPCEIFNLFF
jgi:hypothetical protein